ncbi:succinate--hydroxymethylglutarate CoA-transferase [Nilaparvata lugens]|uniref:succinate--hydroxymethylglutarate CoA-transferase n=1 Tax=Nilaparvata lugens TaxID=108931 RepID=UPI00193CA558|nr:succinate--hydroxymethylglutarate CoA-transferase [Nilaparvata lugens]XP_039280793.1 succinate--hydroxymethylglutarate CoA-transferase [Nilaparvata lugens]XP_039280794.1 succinate--hydroxymethylglutarate CoA-transferase [Nilaparvata lugens]
MALLRLWSLQRKQRLQTSTLMNGLVDGFCSSRPISSTSGSQSALDGIKVLDLTRIVAGPFCTMVLGDLGAEIIKIEQPGTGDESRIWGPPFCEGSSMSCYFASVNRNKKSVCVDFKTSQGLDVIKDLVLQCDVLVENFVPGKLGKFGLDYDSIHSFAPHLIYCSITGFGTEGPYKQKPGYDVIASSYGGLLHITGPQDGGPCKPGVALTDIATGLYAHGAIMAALLQRNKDGKGQRIDCDLLSTQISCLINVASNYLNAGLEGGRYGTAHPSIVPYESFPTANGYLTVGAGSNQQFCSLCKVLHMEHLLQDERYSSNSARVENRCSLIEELSRTFATKTTEEWMAVLEGSPFPFGPVNTVSQVFNDAHVKEIKLVKSMTLEGGGSEVRVVGPPVRFSGSQNSVRLPPPLLGQHTRHVLKDLLDYSDDKILQLIESGVVQ